MGFRKNKRVRVVNPASEFFNRIGVITGKKGNKYIVRFDDNYQFFDSDEIREYD